MAERANITSVEALDAFGAALVLYLNKARPTLDEINAEVVKLRVWLESDRRIFWEKQVRKRALKLEEAKQAVFSAEMSRLRESTSAERTAVTKAQRDLAEAEAKLMKVRRWTNDFESRVAPLAKQLERLQSFLSSGLPQAQSYLTESIRALDAYSGTRPSSGAAVLDSPSTSEVAAAEPAEAATTNAKEPS